MLAMRRNYGISLKDGVGRLMIYKSQLEARRMPIPSLAKKYLGYGPKSLQKRAYMENFIKCVVGGIKILCKMFAYL